MTVTISLMVDPSLATLIVYGMSRDDGTVIGSYIGTAGSSSAGLLRAFEYNENGLSEFTTSNIAYASQATAYGISENGQWLAGDATIPGAPYGIAVYWQNGVASAVGTLAQSPSALFSVDDQGDVAGTVTLSDGNTAAFLQTAASGQITVLGSLNRASASNSSYSTATAMNDHIQVVGYSVYASGNTTQHAFLWQNGVMTDLGTLSGFGSSAAFAINDAGQIVGYSASNHESEEATLWANGVGTDLGGLSGGGGSVANALNDDGQIVGEAFDASGTGHAVLWQNGKIVDLNSLLPANSGWVLTDAQGISDLDQVTGNGFYNGVKTAYLIDLNNTETAAQAAQSATGGGLVTAASVSDTAANVQANLDGLETLAGAGKLTGITLTDSGIPVISVSAAQLTADAAALKSIAGLFDLSITAPATSTTVTGLTGDANMVILPGASSEYTVTATGDGATFTVSGGGLADQVSHVQALKFSDFTDIVASQTPPQAGAISSAQITELYGAVFGRTPDIAGLSYYQNLAAANPSTPFLQYALNFLASPEYANNAAHAYAQTAAGDAQFITDSYQNLLHRAPGSGDAAWYQANIIAPILGNATPGTAAYTQAEALAHAQVLVDFSASAEFLNDVQVTVHNPTSAQHWLLLI